ESDLFAPCSGELIMFNEALLDDPSLINANPYEEGWMFSMNISEDSQLLQPGEYASHLVKAWDVAQKTIKGQANH
ncbi:MAG: glycine cleavage system protein H, partial [Planctomycetota bacterium]|nr:glycine cleavage system protein H [Planctomycetota bacterium]